MAATKELDALIRDTRRIMYRRAADRSIVRRNRASQSSGTRVVPTNARLRDVVNNMVHVGMLLEASAGLSRDGAEVRVIEARCRLDQVIREVRHRAFAENAFRTQTTPEP